MPDQEEINSQQELLATYRRTLAHDLKQRAAFSEGYVPAHVSHGIDEARKNIRHIKQTLQRWGIHVEDLPSDEDDQITTRIAQTGSTLKRRSTFVAVVIIGLVTILLVVFFIKQNIPRSQGSQVASISTPPSTILSPAPTFVSAAASSTSSLPSLTSATSSVVPVPSTSKVATATSKPTRISTPKEVVDKFYRAFQEGRFSDVTNLFSTYRGCINKTHRLLEFTAFYGSSPLNG